MSNSRTHHPPTTDKQQPLRLTDDMLWQPDQLIEDLKKLPNWAKFHQESSKRGLHFDFIVRDKEKRKYRSVTFRLEKSDQGGWLAYELSRAYARLPLQALEEAYRASGRCDAELDRLLDEMAGRTVEVEEFDMF